jgi:hypothetical protein
MPEIYAAHPEYSFERNFKGYGEKGLPGLKWPNNAKIAVSFVINYEEVRQILPKHYKFKILIAIHRVESAQS